MQYLTFSEARAATLDSCRILESECKPLLKALGQSAAETIQSGMNVPDWDYSALDGFAVRSQDIREAAPGQPVCLDVIASVMAGQKARDSLKAGTAIRIMTGAPIPSGADCVIGFEDCRVTSKTRRLPGPVAIFKTAGSGDNIRRAGEQIKQGERVILKGQVIGPGEIGLLASLGITEIRVIKRPQIAIITSGEELVQPGQPLAEAKIYCGNAGALAAQVIRCGGQPRILSIAGDTKLAIRQRIRRGLGNDMIITTGGSAMGDRDLVKEIMAEMGEIVFDQVEMKPGKTTALGRLRPENSGGRWIPHLALSGSPSAAMLGFEALGRPAVMKMMGLECGYKTVVGRAAQDFYNPGGKTRLNWVTLVTENNVLTVRVSGIEGGGVLASISEANGLAIIPADVNKIAAGDCLPVVPLNWK